MGAILLVAVCAGVTPAATILFHGSGVDPVDGADAAVMAHLQATYGEANVTYMQGDAAAGDGSSADGFDAIVISSTLNSGTVRNKYEDAPQGLMNWEQALMRQREGEFNMSVDGRTQGDQTQIQIVDDSHPLAAGLSGTVTVASVANTMSYGVGEIGAGVSLVATSMDGDNAIFAAPAGAAILGDGSPGNPATAAGARVMFFMEDNMFADLTPEGIALFDAAVAYIVPEPTSFALCAMGLFALLGIGFRRR
jgi:hypothetical protein